MGDIAVQSAKAQKSGTEKKKSVSSKSTLELSQTVDSPVKQVLYLQNTIGNRAVTRLIQSGALQAKLKISRPNDVQEKEADRVANEVVSMPEPVSACSVLREEEEKEEGNAKPLIQRAEEEKEEGNPKPLIQRQEEEKEEGNPKPLIQRQGDKSGGQQVSSGWESRLSTAKGGGNPLSDETRAFMEPRFGADFSSVRTHTDSNADRLSSGINAQAFTVGRNIYFGAGQYNTVTSKGRNLLAHELTHTVQQGGAVRKKQLNISLTTPKIQRGWFDDIGGFVKKGVKVVKGAVKKIGSVLKLGLNMAIKKIKPYIRKIPRYYLLTVVIGKDPVTGRIVPRTPRNLVRGLLGRARYNKINKAGAIDAVFKWLNRQVKALKISPSLMWNLLKKAGKYYVANFPKVVNPIPVIKKFFGPPISRIKRFIWAVARKVGIFILRGVLKLVGAPVNRIMKILNKGWAVLKRIINNPIGFARNLLRAVKLGFDWFRKNFVKHLKAAMANWLFGTLTKAGIELPKKFDLKGIFFLVLQILGLTYQNIRAKIVKKLGPRGEQIVSGIEKAVLFVKELVTKGPIVLWEKAKNFLGNLKDMVFGAIIGWVRNTIIQKAVIKILSMFNPAGALYQAAMAIYNIVMFFINRWSQIKALAQAVVNSVGPIVYGRVGKAAKWIEKVMARGLTVIISFLARLVGLGGISNKIREIIQKIRQPIDKVIDKIIDWIIKKGKALFMRGKSAVKKGVEKIKSIIFPRHSFKVGDESHKIWIDSKAAKPRIMISSNVETMNAFLSALKKRSDIDEKKKKRIPNAEAKVEEMRKTIIAMRSEKDRGKSKEKLLRLEIELAEIFRYILSGTKKSRELYKLEGMVATYATMPRVTGDKLTPDHQPQKAVIIAMGGKDYFEGTKASKMAKDKTLKDGMAINVYHKRHVMGRTYGSKGSSTAKQFKNDLDNIPKSDTQDKKRVKAINLLKRELNADVESMRSVYRNLAAYEDIKDDPALVKQVKKQGLQGENRIATQNLDELKN